MLFSQQSAATRSTIGETELAAANEYCANRVRAKDQESYVQAVFLPEGPRAVFLGLRALNVELASDADAVREPVLGQMRLEWWKKALNGLTRPGPDGPIVLEHPVLMALAGAGRPGLFSGMTARWYDGAVDARLAGLSRPGPPASLDALEAYAESTVSSWSYILAAGLGHDSIAHDHLASHLGKAVGLITAIRGTAALAPTTRSHSLPQDLVNKAGALEEDLFAGQATDSIRDVVHQVASTAHGHLHHAAELAESSNPALSGYFLHAVTVADYLDRLKAVNFDLFDQWLAAPPSFRLQWKMLVASIKSRWPL